jgi:hypothetical protein
MLHHGRLRNSFCSTQDDLSVTLTAFGGLARTMTARHGCGCDQFCRPSNMLDRPP